MEVSGFVIGTSSLIPVVEKGLQLMQCISEAKTFGSNLMDLVAELSFEHYRFLLWAQLSGVFDPPAENIGSLSTRLVAVDDLAGHVKEWIENAASRLVSELEAIDKLIQKYQQPLQGNMNQSPSIRLPSIAAGLSSTLPLVGLKHNINLTSKIVQRRNQASELQRIHSFRRRLSFSTKPWGESDKKVLQEKLSEVRRWNNRLESLLPYAVRQSVTNQALPGSVLQNANNQLLEKLLQTSDHESAAVRLHAKLWKEKLGFKQSDEAPIDRAVIQKYRRPKSVIKDIESLAPSNCGLSLITFQDGQNAPERMVLEWYSFGSNWSPSDITLATNRIVELVHLSSLEEKPNSLRLLESICFVETPDSHGVIRRIPKNASRVKHPVSLNSLIQKRPTGFSLPSLESRLQLAQQLVASTYSFSVVRWFHKDFNTHNVFFFRDSSPASAVLLDAPYVSGLSIARPDNDQDKSLNADSDALSIYLHPDLRSSSTEDRPRYHRKYEFYSVGLVLLEIGCWRTIDSLPGVKGSLDKFEFKNKVTERAKKELPFYMGKRYTDVVVYCLTCADDSDELTTALETLYKCVVLELAKCCN